MRKEDKKRAVGIVERKRQEEEEEKWEKRKKRLRELRGVEKSGGEVEKKPRI